MPHSHGPRRPREEAAANTSHTLDEQVSRESFRSFSRPPSLALLPTWTCEAHICLYPVPACRNLPCQPLPKPALRILAMVVVHLP